MLKELFAIGDFPALLDQAKRSFIQKLLSLLKTYGLIFLYVMALIPVLLMSEYLVTHVLHFRSIRKQGSFTFEHLIQKLGYLKALIYICLFGPLLEETVFRLPLSFKRVPIMLSIAFAVFLFSGVMPPVKNLSLFVGVGYALLIRLGCSGIIYLVCLKLLPVNLSVSGGYKKAIIIVSICVFGLMHILNYVPLQWALIWIYPFYVLPQLGMGWALAYIRFKNGFIWGVALHCLINSMSMLVYYRPAMPVKVRHTQVAGS